jgi:O-antigen/teichoic acid export membrane protein
MLLANVSSKLASLLSISFLAKAISSIDLGIYNAFINTTAYFNQLSDLGASTVLQLKSAKFRNSTKDKLIFEHRLSAGILLGCMANAICCVAIILFQDEILDSLFSNTSADLLHLLLPITCIQFFAQLPTYVLMGIGHFKRYSYRNLITSFILLFGVAIPAFFYGLAGAVTGYLIAIVVNAILTWHITITILREEHMRFNFKHGLRSIPALLSEGLWLYVGSTLLGALGGLVTIRLFNQYISIEEFGFLRIAASINAITAIIPTALMPVTLTLLSGKSADKGVRLKSFQIRYISSLILIFTVILLFFLPQLLRWIFGAAYLKGEFLIGSMLLINIIVLLQGIYSNFLIAQGKMSFLGTVSTIGILLHIILCFLLVPSYQNIGYLIAWGVPQLLSHIITVGKEFSSEKGYSKDRKTKLFYLTFVAISFYIAIIHFTMQASHMNTSLLAAGVLVYCVIFYKFVISDEERQALHSKWLTYFHD